MTRMLLSTLILLSYGCAAQRGVQQAGLVNRAETPTNTGGAEAGPGGIAIAPQIAISGGAGLMFVVAAGATVLRRRDKRVMRALIEAIERHSPAKDAWLKQVIGRSANRHGVKSYLKRTVRRTLGKQTD